MKLKLFIVIICWLAFMSAKAQTFDFSSIKKSTVTDYDGNVYPTIKIGDYWWMAENLRTTHFNDGSEISYLGTGGVNYTNTKYGYAYPHFDPLTVSTYGLLYTWNVAVDMSHSGACPSGWTLPDTAIWYEMARTIGCSLTYDSVIRNTPNGGTETVYEVTGVSTLGQYLKSDNGVLWKIQPSISTECNQTGMNIAPAGYIQSEAAQYFGRVANFWTPNYVHSDSSGQGRKTIWFDYSYHNMVIGSYHNANPTSVRCVKRSVDTTKYYKVTIMSPTNGTLIVFLGNDTVVSGDTVPCNTLLTFKAEPDAGCQLDSFLVNGVRSVVSYVVNCNVSISVVYSLATITKSAISESISIYSAGKSIYIQSPPRAHVTIYTLSGQIVNTIETTSSLQKIDLNKSGFYIVKMENKNGTKIAKCIIN